MKQAAKIVAALAVAWGVSEAFQQRGTRHAVKQIQGPRSPLIFTSASFAVYAPIHAAGNTWGVSEAFQQRGTRQSQVTNATC
jgi:hypothetical protein